jgi:hypothetical protein
MPRLWSSILAVFCLLVLAGSASGSSALDRPAANRTTAMTLGQLLKSAPAGSHWHGSVQLSFTSDKTEGDSSASNTTHLEEQGTYTFPQDIAKTTVSFSYTVHEVNTAFATNCTTMADGGGSGQGVAHGDMTKVGGIWQVGFGHINGTNKIHFTSGGDCPGDSYDKSGRVSNVAFGVPVKVVQQGNTLVAKGQGPVLAAYLSEQCAFKACTWGAVTGSYSYNLSYSPPPPVDYSLAGVCGKLKDGGGERCYVMLGAPTVRAIKHHEGQFAGGLAAAAQSAMPHTAKTVFDNYAARRLRKKAIKYTITRLAGESVERAYGGFSFGMMLGKIATAAIFAQRWADLERAGYPHKCFLFELTYQNGASIGFDPIYSFVRSWDSLNPPSYRPRTTSLGHWEAPHHYDASLPLFCKGASGQAVTLGSSSGLAYLLGPPYISFSVDFNH